MSNFKYHIKYPTNESINNIKLPVIILLGWAGCNDKYLSKYSAVYEEKGYATLRTTAPVKTLFLHRASMVSLAKTLVQTIYERKLEKRPLIFHLFSNGGSYLYGHLIKITENKPLNVQGIIFDSSPGRKRFSSLWGAMSAILGGPIIAFLAASALVTIWSAQQFWYSYILKEKEPYGDPFNPLLTDPSRCPQLCLYSQEDELIAAQDIEEFIEIRKECGVDVTSVCFEKSQHVKHLLSHREKYISSLMQFVKKCSK